MNGRHGRQDGQKQIDGGSRGQATFPSQAISERLALKKLHCDEGHTFVRSEIEHIDNVWMPQLRGRFGLGGEALEHIGVVNLCSVQNLQRHSLAEGLLRRLVNRTERTGAE